MELPELPCHHGGRRTVLSPLTSNSWGNCTQVHTMLQIAGKHEKIWRRIWAKPITRNVVRAKLYYDNIFVGHMSVKVSNILCVIKLRIVALVFVLRH